MGRSNFSIDEAKVKDYLHFEEGDDVVAPREVILPSYTNSNLPGNAKNGSMAYDSTSTCISVRLNGSWTCMNDRGNRYSTSFDGNNEYANIDDVYTALASTTTGTWECWFKPVDLGSGPSVGRIFNFGKTAAGADLIFLEYTNGGLIRAGATKSSSTKWFTFLDSAALSEGTWTHVMLVQNGVAPVIYINGIAVDQSITVTTDTTLWFSGITVLDNGRIANGNFSGLGETKFGKGNIDNVGFYNTNLSAAEALESYNSGKALDLTTHSKTANLVSYFTMGDNDSHPTLTDNKGSNDGTLVNSEAADFQLDTP